MAISNSDKFLRFILVAVAVVTCVTLLVGLVSAMYGVSNANNSDKVVLGNDLNACRSQLNASVTDARTNVDEARTGYEVALGLVAQQLAARGDVTEALQSMVTASDDIAAKTQTLRDETDKYRAAVKQSSTDPAAFLATYCN